MTGAARSGRRGGRLGGGRAVLVAVVSTIVVFSAVGWIVTHSPGWPLVQREFFDADEFREALPEAIGRFRINVQLFVLAEALILVFALVLAVMRSLPGPVFFPIRAMAIVYVDVFRSLPALLVIYVLGFGIPTLRIEGVPRDPFFWAVVALTLLYSAYVSEVYRAGIESVHPSQTAAARSLGLGRGQAMRYVVLPQAIKRVLPPLLNDFIGLQKDSALVAVLGVTEGLRQAQITQATFFNFTPYVSLALVYVLITIPQVLFVDWLIKRDQRRQQAGGVG